MRSAGLGWVMQDFAGGCPGFMSLAPVDWQLHFSAFAGNSLASNFKEIKCAGKTSSPPASKTLAARCVDSQKLLAVRAHTPSKTIDNRVKYNVNGCPLCAARPNIFTCSTVNETS